MVFSERIDLVLRVALWAYAGALIVPFAYGEISPLVFRYKGQSYTISDLTLVSSNECQRYIEEARRMYQPDKHRRPEVALRPQDRPWKTDGPEDMEAFYRHEINGAIRNFVYHEVFLTVLGDTDGELIKKYLDTANLDAYVRDLAKVEQSYLDADMTAFAGAHDPTRYAALCQNMFPTVWGASYYSNNYAYLTLSYPYRYLVWRCFPLIRGRDVPPWACGGYEGPLLVFYVRAKIEESPQEYVELYESRYGRRNAILLHNLRDDCLPQALQVVNLIGNASGDTAVGGLRQVNQVLRDLASQISLEFCDDSLEGFSERYNLPVDAVRPLRMLDIGPSKSNPGLNDYLYICQVKACAVEKEYSTSPGGFLFGFAEAIILEPLCERVLKSLQVVDGYCLPHGYRDLSIRGCGVRTNRFGRALPRLVLANDQKTIIARTEVSGIQSELIRSIRDICGNLKSPEVIRLAPSEMDAHFREVSVKTAHNATATNGWAFLPSPHAFYSPSSNTVFMTDRGAAWSSAAITASDIDALRDAGLFHECVHAWQQQNLLARGAPAASDLVVNAILEGHAEFCTREYLTRKGQSALRDRLLKEKRDYFVGLSSSDQAIASRFMYVDGLRFFEFLSRQNPPLGIRDVFERGLPTERQILLPEEYLHPRQASAPPFAPWLATLQRLFGTGPGDISTVSPAGFRAYVEQISAVPKDRTTLLVRMIDGKRAQRGNFMATLLAFESSDDASRTFYLVTRDHERRRRIKLSDPAALPDRGGACSHYTPPEGGTPTVAPVWASGVGVPASAGMSCCPRPPHYQHGK